MISIRRLVVLLLTGWLCQGHAQKSKKADPLPYYPGAEWIHKTPVEAGMDGVRLKEAIDFAITHEAKSPRDLELSHYQSFGIREPLSDPIGPMKTRGEASGVIIKNGYI